MHPAPTCDRCLTRRQCLKMFSAAALGSGLAGGIIRAADEPKSAAPAPPIQAMDPAKAVDVARLRPAPKVRIQTAVLRQPLPYWLGWPGTSYDVEKYSKEYLQKTGESARRLGIDAQIEPKPVEDENGFAALLAKAKAEKPDALLVILQHMSCWDWADRLSKEAGVPLIVFSPVGTSFTGHVLGISRRPGTHVVSSLEWSAVEAGFRMVKAKRMLEESRILWIQGNQRNETVLERLGTKVRAIPRDSFNKLFDQVPMTAEVKDIAADMRRRAQRIVEPTEQDTQNSARAYVTAKMLMEAEGAHALSMDCLGMVHSKLVPTPPCGAWTLLQDQGITAGCEADLFGATSMMLTSYLLDRPGYMNDPVAETAKNLLIASHCTSGTRLAGFDKAPAPYILRSHSESSLGVSVQVVWPAGEPVSLIRFTGPGEVIVDTGTVVSNIDTPPAGGCRTSIEIKMDDIEDARDVLGFHQVVTLGNHKRTVQSFCQLYGMRMIHSPEKAPHGEGSA